MAGMKRGNWKTRKAKKRDIHRSGQRYMQPKSTISMSDRPKLSNVGKAIREIAKRMGKRGD